MRITCPRCRRPDPLCVCKDLPAIASTSLVVLLQHPREAKVAICSARLTRLALARAELHRGVVFEDDARVRALAETPGAALLFPGAGAIPAEQVTTPPSVLFVFDGTWFHAGKMLSVNPRLAALPRIAVLPSEPSGYGELRREPAPGHLSTAEAVALALGALERDPEKYAPLVRAFRKSVALQLDVARSAKREPRHRPPRPDPE